MLEPAQRDLAAGQERVDAHQVHDDAALDLFHQRTLDAFILLVRPPRGSAQTRMKSAFFFERTTAPSWLSRCSRKTSTSHLSLSSWDSLNSSIATRLPT